MNGMKSRRGHIAVGMVLMTWMVLLRTDFATDADLKGWTKGSQAFVSDIGRRNGTRSLLIKQWKDEEQDTHWRPPAIKNPGKPVKLSFWAADSYLKQEVDSDRDGETADDSVSGEFLSRVDIGSRNSMCVKHTG